LSRAGSVGAGPRRQSQPGRLSRIRPQPPLSPDGCVGADRTRRRVRTAGARNLCPARPGRQPGAGPRDSEERSPGPQTLPGSRSDQGASRARASRPAGPRRPEDVARPRCDRPGGAARQSVPAPRGGSGARTDGVASRDQSDQPGTVAPREPADPWSARPRPRLAVARERHPTAPASAEAGRSGGSDPRHAAAAADRCARRSPCAGSPPTRTANPQRTWDCRVRFPAK
jgi:hypothetical protein